MTRNVYINHLAKFLPNDPVSNEEMESRLGRVDDRPSRTRRIVLRQNGIKRRYYAIDAEGGVTHTNSQLTANAVRALLTNGVKPEDVELLACGTSSPDQLVPSHAVMVHGELGGGPLEALSPSGVCCSGMHALKYGFLSVLSGATRNAVCTGSEAISNIMRGKYFRPELERLEELERAPILAFEKDFLRWMLSDGAGAALLQSESTADPCLKIEWIETVSFAHATEVCMYSGCEKLPGGSVRPWREMEVSEWLEKSIFAVKQDVRLLDANAVKLACVALRGVIRKRGLSADSIDFFLPHLSSEYFRKPLEQAYEEAGLSIPRERWFTNLAEVGNVGSASIYLMMEALLTSGRLQKGQRILLFVPESARFSYAYSLLTVC